MIAMTEVGNWMTTYPDKYLEDTYLKFIGWMLHDVEADVRFISPMGVIIRFVVGTPEVSGGHTAILRNGKGHGRCTCRAAGKNAVVHVEIQEENCDHGS